MVILVLGGPNEQVDSSYTTLNPNPFSQIHDLWFCFLSQSDLSDHWIGTSPGVFPCCGIHQQHRVEQQWVGPHTPALHKQS